MRLKKLTILGFKSFADKISIDFDCEIIGVVGPNGCGKSNIVDAFRWVMGEQSAKSLRGDKMHDVLFAGTDKRKPLNLAEVSVTLSEIEGALPLPYDEVTITRRLYRSGESEYLINKEPVRLKDLQSLFLGSGMGKNTFSVFEQGKLDQVIHLNPTERRSIFDEAAGIGRFLQRKKETVRKLAQVSENYNRVKDVHHEVEKQTRQLKKQAVQAKNFQENKSRLEGLERALLVTRWRNLQAKHADLETNLHAATEEVKQQHYRLVAIEENLEKTKQVLAEKQSAAKAEQHRLHKAETKAHVQEAELRSQERFVEELEKKVGSLSRERSTTLERRQRLATELEDKKAALADLETKKTALESRFNGEKLAYEKSERVMSEVRNALKVAREKHVSAIQEESRLQNALQEKKMHLSATKQRIESVERRLKEDRERIDQEITKKTGDVATLSREIDALKAEEERAEKLVRASKEEEKRLMANMQSSSQALTEVTARFEALLRLKEASEGFSSGAKVLLKDLKGTVKELFAVLKVPGELALALYPYAHTLVVSSKKDLEAVLTHAAKKKLTDFSVVCLDEKTFLKGIQVAEDLKGLKASGGVTRDGFVVDAKGVIFRYNAQNKEGNPFLREAELEELAQQLEVHKREREKCTHELETLLSKQKSEEEAHRSAVENRRKKEMVHVQENFALQRARTDLERCESEFKKLQGEKIALQDAVEGDFALSALADQLKTHQKETQTCLQQFSEQEKLVDGGEKALQKAFSTWQEAQAAFQGALSIWQAKNQEISLLASSELQCGVLITKLSEQEKDAKNQLVSLQEKIKERRLEIEKGKKALSDLEQTAQQEDDELERTLSTREELEKHLAEKRGELARLEKKHHQLELVLAEDTAQRKSIEEELLERHHLPKESLSACEDSVEGELAEVEKELRHLRVTVEKAGAVNMTAIDEYQEQVERFQELDGQLVDLEEAKSDLESVIGKLDTESRKIFKETFEQIRENFRKNFAILFRGGEADLKFTESPDVLEAGIEIVAKPPGKQMRSISLLSGGEKCLTALALLFSIFEVRPAPFCILDEVDAPLDDSNIERFTTVLRQYIQNTQFIVVTHNKKTMSIADLLLGVSMEEKGVSKLLSIAFEKVAT